MNAIITHTTQKRSANGQEERDEKIMLKRRAIINRLSAFQPFRNESEL